MLKTNRSLVKFILFSLITFGIYSLFFMNFIRKDVNIICSPFDGKKTMNFFLLFFVISPLTAEIAFFVWFHRISNRIWNELKARGFQYEFSSSAFWWWGILGTLILVDPFVYLYRMFHSMNLICESYNAMGGLRER